MEPEVDISYEVDQICEECMKKQILFNKKREFGCSPLPKGYVENKLRNIDNIGIDISKINDKYQRKFIFCTALKKALWIDRQMGKTHSIILSAIHYSIENPGKTSVIVVEESNSREYLIRKIHEILSKTSLQYTIKNNFIKLKNSNIMIIGESKFLIGIKVDNIYFDNVFSIDIPMYIPATPEIRVSWTSSKIFEKNVKIIT